MVDLPNLGVQLINIITELCVFAQAYWGWRLTSRNDHCYCIPHDLTIMSAEIRQDLCMNSAVTNRQSLMTVEGIRGMRLSMSFNIEASAVLLTH